MNKRIEKKTNNDRNVNSEQLWNFSRGILEMKASLEIVNYIPLPRIYRYHAATSSSRNTEMADADEIVNISLKLQNNQCYEQKLQNNRNFIE